MREIYWLVCVVFISLFSFLPLCVSGYFPMHDDLQVERLYQFDLCIRDFQIPCRWVPDMSYGYGYPLFNYYPPFPYYLGEIFHLLGFSLINSIKIVFILGLIFSGIFAYLLGRELWGKIGGLVVSAFYIYAPYHAVDVYVRGALNEFWGLVFFPAVFWAIYKLVKEEKKIYIVVLSLFYGLLLLSHNLMSFFFTPAVVLWALFLLWYFKKSLKILIKLAFSGILGVGLAAFFVLPMFFEKKFVHFETMFERYYSYLIHFPTIKQLFFSRFWGYGPSIQGPNDGMAFSIGHLHWIMAFISIFIFVLLWLKQRKKEFLLVFFYFLFFAFYSFLSHDSSIFIWRAIAVLSYMQFPWRFVGLASFFATILAGSIFILIQSKIEITPFTIIVILAVIAFNAPFFHPKKILKITDKEKILSIKGVNKPQRGALFDYLPIYAKKPPNAPAPKTPWFVNGKGKITDFKKGTDWQSFSVDIASAQATIRLPLYDFPKWEVWVENKTVVFNHENELGLITFDIPKGTHHVIVRLKNTPIRAASNLISLISWIALIGIIICKSSVNAINSSGG